MKNWKTINWQAFPINVSIIKLESSNTQARVEKMSQPELNTKSRIKRNLPVQVNELTRLIHLVKWSRLKL